ncbi:hypothetical protein MMC25_003812 [Agyrium rufum]|nr:hypothetical protein [Agyrium rufum]
MTNSVLITGFALLSTATALGTTAITVILTVEFAKDHEALLSTTIASAVLELISALLTITVFVECKRKSAAVRANVKEHQQGDLAFLLPWLLISIVGLAVTLATLVWMKIVLDQLTNLILGQPSWVFLVILFALWVLTLLASIVLYILLLRRTRKSDTGFVVKGVSGSSNGNSLEADRSGIRANARTPESHRLSMLRTSPKTVAANGSHRSSLTIAVHPASSKTKLLQRASFISRNSVHSSTGGQNPSRMSRDSGLDTWDTSAVTPNIRETVLRANPSTANQSAPLATIPGSRSPSPGHALDGPFYFPIPPTTASSPNMNPTQNSNPVLPESHPTSPDSSPNTRMNFSRPHHRQRSYSNESSRYQHENNRKTSISEEHIHPLFRTTSPTPAPAATLGTIVTAAPGSFTGLHINERSLYKIRSDRNMSSAASLRSMTTSPIDIISPSAVTWAVEGRLSRPTSSAQFNGATISRPGTGQSRPGTSQSRTETITGLEQTQAHPFRSQYEHAGRSSIPSSPVPQMSSPLATPASAYGTADRGDDGRGRGQGYFDFMGRWSGRRTSTLFR